MERATDWKKTFKVEWDMTNDVGLGVVLEEGRGEGEGLFIYICFVRSDFDTKNRV